MALYPSLADLQKAFQAGALDREQVWIWLDNDDTYLYGEDEEESLLNGGDPEALLREALDLLGIPWRNM